MWGSIIGTPINLVWLATPIICMGVCFLYSIAFLVRVHSILRHRTMKYPEIANPGLMLGGNFPENIKYPVWKETLILSEAHARCGPVWISYPSLTDVIFSGLQDHPTVHIADAKITEQLLFHDDPQVDLQRTHPSSLSVQEAFMPRWWRKSLHNLKASSVWLRQRSALTRQFSGEAALSAQLEHIIQCTQAFCKYWEQQQRQHEDRQRRQSRRGSRRGSQGLKESAPADPSTGLPSVLGARDNTMEKEISEDLSRLSIDILGAICLGRNCDCVGYPNAPFYHGIKLSAAGLLSARRHSPLTRLLSLRRERRYCRGLRFLRHSIDLMIVDAKATQAVASGGLDTREEISSVSRHPSILHALVYPSVMQDKPLSTGAVAGGCLNDDEIRDNLIAFLIFGSEALSNTIEWTLQLLSHHPDIQKEIREELEKALISGSSSREKREHCSPHNPLDGKSEQRHGDRSGEGSSYGSDEEKDSGDLTLQSSKALILARSCVLEALRLFSVIPSLQRTIKEEVQVEGDNGKTYRLPKHAVLKFNTFLLSKSPKIWGDTATNFDPHRFMAQNGSTDHKSFIAEGGFLPFGIGSRGCIAEDFALTACTVIVATLIDRFEFLEQRPISPNGGNNGEVGMEFKEEIGVGMCLRNFAEVKLRVLARKDRIQNARKSIITLASVNQNLGQ